MSNEPLVRKYNGLRKLVDRFRDDLRTSDFVLLFAYNGTGKTRLSMEFKEFGKKNNSQRVFNQKGEEVFDQNGEEIYVARPDTLYFNAFTEDLFSWDNDLEQDKVRVLKINTASKFFRGFKELSMEQRIATHLSRYANFSFDVGYEKSEIVFKRNILKKAWEGGEQKEKTEEEYHIKISRGEENVFIWCVFLVICDLSIERDNAYQWVNYIYIDDPVSSLDENNVIAIASDLAQLLKKGVGKTKMIISSHHSLFFNVMCNELKKNNHVRYFLHKNSHEDYTLQKTDETPFFHHVALLSELQQLKQSQKIYTYHFNILRTILEKTSSFFGYNDFSACIHGINDEVLFARALNLLSHGKYSVFEPVQMSDDNKQLFLQILDSFLERYKFDLPKLIAPDKKQKTTTITKEQL